jgi:Asp/Glu/hydantoin racemase
MAKITGGKTIYGASVGILMLETRFPRIPGDVGNAATWPFPVLYKVVRDATPDRVVRQQADGLKKAFIDAAQELVAAGVDGITTNCGFLSLFQDELAAACGVPVAASSLLQVNMVNSLLPAGKRAGILTISKATLTEAHLVGAHVPLDTPVGGTDDGLEFSRAILDNELELDVEQSRKDVVDAGLAMQYEHADLGALVLECTNMPPFSADLAMATGLPVYDYYSLITWFQSGLNPRRFA